MLQEKIQERVVTLNVLGPSAPESLGPITHEQLECGLTQLFGTILARVQCEQEPAGLYIDWIDDARIAPFEGAVCTCWIYDCNGIDEKGRFVVTYRVYREGYYSNDPAGVLVHGRLRLCA